MNERHPAERAAIDLALAHSPKDKVEAAYNRATYIERRRSIMQSWGDMLCGATAEMKKAPTGWRFPDPVCSWPMVVFGHDHR